MSVYLVDSNFFIQAHRNVYPLDVVPSFWIKIKELAISGKIISLDKVKNEIFDNEDDLTQWCKSNLPPNFFKDSQTCIVAYQKVCNWAISRNDHYRQNAIDEFLHADEADAFLIAYALTSQLAIITHEVANPATSKKIKIPDVCEKFKLKYHTTIEMFRELKEQF